MSPEIRTRWQRFERSADAYRAVTILLLLLIVVPIATPQNVEEGALTAVMSGAAATLALAASQARRWAVLTAAIAWLVVVLPFFIPGEQVNLVEAAAIVLAVLLISAPVVILRRIAKHDEVTATTMWGAVAAYLSLGIALSFIYASIYSIDAGSFVNVIDGGFGEFNYFSFVTMTTLGYGDITPVSDLTRALVVFQTVIGQIYLVVVVARVVSLLGSGRRLGRPDTG